MCACGCASVHVCVQVCTWVCKCARVCASVHVCVQVCTWVCMCIVAYVTSTYLMYIACIAGGGDIFNRLLSSYVQNRWCIHNVLGVSIVLMIAYV